MNVGTEYYWSNGEVVTLNEDTSPWEYKNCFSLDTTTEMTHHRYGKYTDQGWKHFPLEEFPPEFKLSLVLLGVSL